MSSEVEETHEAVKDSSVKIKAALLQQLYPLLSVNWATGGNPLSSQDCEYVRVVIGMLLLGRFGFFMTKNLFYFTECDQYNSAFVTSVIF